MKLNSPESLRTARRLIEQHGSWSAVRQAGHRTPTGVIVVAPEEPGRFEALKAAVRERRQERDADAPAAA